MIALLLAALLAGPAPAAPPAPRLRIEATASFTINFVHWVDNLAGTSGGKTIATYQRYWEERFGPMGPEDREALATFARIRTLDMTEDAAIENEQGCLPIRNERLTWHQRFLVAAMEADSVEAMLARFSDDLTPEQTEELAGALARFRPRFDRVWRDMDHVRRFEKRFKRFLARGDLLRYLDGLAGFFGVDPDDMPPMQVSLVALPLDGNTHAEADGDHLLVEIRPDDSPEMQIPVVSHEATHFLMRRMGAAATDALARQAFAQGDAGAIVWRLMWEGIPTALGQGLAVATLTPEAFSLSSRWYHRPAIDFFAKAIYEGLTASVRAGETIHDGTMARLTRIATGTPYYTDAHALDFVLPGFFASGEGMEGALATLRRRLGLDGTDPAFVFGLDDVAALSRTRRYDCLGGVVLVTPAQLDAALAIDTTPLLDEATAARVREAAQRGASILATGRRPGGGRVYLLVAPDASSAALMTGALARLQGAPGPPIVIKDRALSRE